MSIQVLHQQGMSKRGIARQLGISINTVRKYLREAGEPQYKNRRSVSKLDPNLILKQAHPMVFPADEIETWKEHYNHIRPHSSLNYMPPSVFTKETA